MAVDREWQVRLQFLDEAGDYLREIERCLLGCSERGLPRETIDITLRAAHSIKGGAAMMGFNALSDLAHRLEDALKVMQTGRVEADSSLEQLFLDALTQMERVALVHQQQQPISATWLATEIEPPFTELYNRLGTPSDNDHAAALSAESGVDMRVIMFETEVDACLARLEQVLADPTSLVLREEFLLASQEFGCLGEMLDLSPFVALCNQITTAIEEDLVPLETIAPVAFQTWRKSQALVMVGQWAALPEQLPLEIPQWQKSSPEASILDNSIHDQVPQDEDIEELDLFSDTTPDLDLIDYTWNESDIVTDFADSLTEDLAGDFDDIGVNNIEIDESLAFTSVNSSENSLLGQSDDLETVSQQTIQPITESDILDLDLLDISQNIAAYITEDTTNITDLTEPEQTNSNANISIEEVSHNKTANDQITNNKELTEASKPSLSEVTLRIPLLYLEQLSELFGDINAERNSLNIQLKSLHNLVTLLRNRVAGLEVSNQQLRNAYDLVVGTQPQMLKSQLLGHSLNNPQLTEEYNDKLPQTLSLGLTKGMLGNLGVLEDQLVETQQKVVTDFDALEMDRYNNFHLLARDIMDSVVQLQEVSHDMDTTLNEAEGSARELGRIARQMQTSLERLRMRRLDEILSNFPRVLRELSLRYGKSVQLVVRGGSTLVERSVLEQLNDPLLHLLRNAFDHGIETTAERITAGKEPKGTIEIIAAYRGNQTIITLRDDGGGINLPKIREKAKLMGLSDQEIDQAGEAALLDLIFSPGFTTAETVTTLSGRGVGMDVVRTNLRRIGGDVTVKTSAGEGTTFTLSVPVSLAIAQVLLVESNGFMMAVPVTAVEEMLLLEQYPIAELESGQTLQWLEHTIPLINLADKIQSHATIQ